MKEPMIYFPDEVLNSQRLFNDWIIGALLANTRFPSLKRIAEDTGFTPRRIALAAARLEKAGTLRRIHNYIVADVDTRGSTALILKFRKDLLHHHGIRTPKPVYFRRHWQAVVYAPNTYFFSIDARGITDTTPRHLTPKFTNGRLLPLTSTTKYNLWEFNPPVYSFTDYLQDHGFRNI